MPHLKTEAKIIKVVLIGAEAVGKTSLLKNYTKNLFDGEYKPTIGVDFGRKTTSFLSSSLEFHIWDTSGQERFRNLLKTYCDGAGVFVFVVDITKPQSLEAAQELKKTMGIAAPHSMLIVTKTDTADTDRKVSEAELKELAEALNCNTPLAKQLGCKPFYETSAKDNTGIEEAFVAAGKLGLGTLDPTLSFLTEEKYDFDEDEDDVKPVLTCGTKLAAFMRFLFCCSGRCDRSSAEYTAFQETDEETPRAIL